MRTVALRHWQIMQHMTVLAHLDPSYGYPAVGSGPDLLLYTLRLRKRERSNTHQHCEGTLD